MSADGGTGGNFEPGWYADGSGAVRWWSGSEWTEHTQATTPPQNRPTAPPHAPSGPSTRKRWVALTVVGIVLLIVTVVAAAFVFLKSESPEEVVARWERADSCEEMAELQWGVSPAELVGSSDPKAYCAWVEEFDENYKLRFEVLESEQGETSATVVVSEKATYQGDDEDLESYELESTFQLSKIDDAWMITSFDFVTKS